MTDPLLEIDRWRTVAGACAAQVLSVLGEHVFLLTALPVWVYDRTRSPAVLSWTFILLTLPALLSLPAGVWISRMPTRRVLTACGGARLLFTLIPLFLPAPPSLPVVLGSAFCISLVDSFFMPALKAALPGLVRPENLLRANSFLEGTDIPPQLLGPPLAIFLYERWGLPGPILAQALAYAVSLAILARLPFPWNGGPSGEPGERIFSRLRRTLLHAWQSAPVRGVLAAWTLGMAAAGMGEALLLPFIREVLRQPDAVFGVFGALVGLGMAVGAGLSTLYEPEVSMFKLFAASTAFSCAAFAAFTLGRSVAACGAALTALGTGLVWTHVSSNTLLQEEIREEHLAGALGLTHSIEAAGLLLGIWLGGEGAERYGTLPTFRGTVLLLLCAVALAVRAAYREAGGSPRPPQ